MMQYDIVGVGHNCVDKLCVVEDYPREDSSTHITSITTQGGGAVATALVAAARLGMSAAFIGTCGFDGASEEGVAMLERENVTPFVQKRKDCFGLESFVMINGETGTRTKFPVRDTNPPIEWTEELKNVIRSSKILHIDGTNYPNALSAAKIAKEAGVTISLDGCSMQKDNEKNKALLSYADILIMNKKYPKVVTGLDDYEEALITVSKWGPKIVMCTLGNEGELAVIDGKVKHFDAIEAGAVVDTTGAGDVFHGAFLTGHLKGMDLEENIDFASAVAAIKCRKIGGRSGIPKIDEALELIGIKLGLGASEKEDI